MRSTILFAFVFVLSVAVLPSPAEAKKRKVCRACKKHNQGGTTGTPVGLFESTQTASTSRSLSSSSNSAAASTDAPSVTASPSSKIASSSSSSSSSSATTSARQTNEDESKGGNPGVRTYKVLDDYSGKSFFDGFNFNDFPDPTHGNVNYQNRDAAFGQGLAYVQDDGIAVTKVDDSGWVNAGANRNSVRLESKKGYSSGLIVADVVSMPFGCGVWPALWTVGQNWPSGGEIDILENVHDAPNNQMTLHTAAGCTIDRSFQKVSKRRRSGGSTVPHAGSGSQHSKRAATGGPGGIAFTGRVLADNCDANVNGNTGCGIQDPDPKSYGSALNNAGGGVFATLINDDGVAIWFFPRGQIPDDLSSKAPQPATWPSPKAFWASSSCPTGKFFKEQKIVINTTLCGDWAGATYQSVGCPGTCAQRLADPNNFKSAQWKIRSVTVYN